MLKQIYRWFCYIGLHRYEKVDINFSFGPGGSTETIKCIDCGIKKIISKPWLAFTFLFVISIFFANHIDKFELDALL